VVNNQTTFRVGWTAPATGAGGVNFDVWALSGSGGDGSNGDGGGEAYVSFTYGCSGQNYYPDGDNDGFGSKVLPYVRDCTKPNFRTLDNTDCNDYEAKIHPGQPEICNGKDDNCDGQIDEGLPIMTVYEDKDGDGYGGWGPPKPPCFAARPRASVSEPMTVTTTIRPSIPAHPRSATAGTTTATSASMRRRRSTVAWAGAGARVMGVVPRFARPANRAPRCATPSTTIATA